MPTGPSSSRTTRRQTQQEGSCAHAVLWAHSLPPSWGRTQNALHSPISTIRSKQRWPHNTRFCNDNGILLTNFGCVFPCTAYHWIFMALERPMIPAVVRNPRPAECGVRQGVPASGFMFAVAAGPVCSWISDQVLPIRLERPFFCNHLHVLTQMTSQR